VHDGKRVLIIERGKDATYDPKKWEFVSGMIGEGDLSEQAKAQVLKETGLDAELIKVGNIFEVQDRHGLWRIYPFLFKPHSDSVKLDSQHTGYAWIEPSQLGRYDCVKDLDKNLTALGLSKL